jgi:hypothetical protein
VSDDSLSPSLTAVVATAVRTSVDFVRRTDGFDDACPDWPWKPSDSPCTSPATSTPTDVPMKATSMATDAVCLLGTGDCRNVAYRQPETRDLSESPVDAEDYGDRVNEKLSCNSGTEDCAANSYKLMDLVCI